MNTYRDLIGYWTVSSDTNINTAAPDLVTAPEQNV